jgi:formylglycine-generating enzyme required for sulfatase activity
MNMLLGRLLDGQQRGHQPVRRVTPPFAIGRYPVSVGEWNNVPRRRRVPTATGKMTRPSPMS